MPRNPLRPIVLALTLAALPAWAADNASPYTRAIAPVVYAPTTQPGATALGGSSDPLTFPAPDPEYLRWEKLWDQSRMLEAQIARLRYDIAFLRTMRTLDLTKDQMKKMLPLATQARLDSRQATANFLANFEHIALVKKGFADDILYEDLVAKHGRKIVNGNFDKEYWDKSFPMTHPSPCPTPQQAALHEKVRNSGLALDALLTPDQSKLLADALKADASKSDLAYDVQGLRGTWIAKFNFVPVQYLGTLNTGNSIKEMPTPATGLLIAPLAVEYLQQQLGRVVQADPDAATAEERDARCYWLARLERRVHRRVTVPYNWIKGAQLTTAQTESFAKISRQLLDLYLAEEEQWQKDTTALLANYTTLHDDLLAAKPLPDDLLAKVRTDGARLVGSYWSGAACAGGCAEDHTFPARGSGIWKMFPDQTPALMAQADAVLLESQKIVVWDVHGDCYRPWRVFTNPVNAGEPAQGLIDSPALTKLYALPADQQPAEIQQLADTRLADMKAKALAAKKPLTDAQLADERAATVKFLDTLCHLTPAAYQLSKASLAYQFLGTQGCGYINDPSGIGTPEQNGEWPHPDWNDKEVRAKWEARLENLLLPELVPFYQTRASLMQQFKPAAPINLDHLPKSTEKPINP